MLACLYDVHGNLPALEAVLDDARAAGATSYVLGGDYALMGGWPAECVERLRALRSATWIRGNVDRWTPDPPDDDVIRAAAQACAAAVGPGGVRALANLPQRAQIADWMIVHASPASDVQGFAATADATDEELIAAAPMPARNLMFGHTHIQFLREVDGVTLLNPGSVGIPLDGDHRAAYALIGDAVELRRVAYDHEASAARVRAFGEGAPWTEVAAGRIERAAFE